MATQAVSCFERSDLEMLRTTPERANLRCPTCRDLSGSHALEWGDVRDSDGDDVLAGALRCTGCAMRYPVEDGVAVVVRDVEAYVATERAFDDEQLGTYLWSDYGDRYAPTLPTGLTRGVHPAEDLLLRLTNTDRAIDLGCGSGGSTFRLATRAGFALGIDARFERIRAAVTLRRRGALEVPVRRHSTWVERGMVEMPDLQGAACDFLVADVVDPPLAPEDWDAALLAMVYDVVNSPALLLDQVGALLKDGGLVCMASPYQFAPAHQPMDPGADLRRRLGTTFAPIAEDERLWLLRDNDRRWFVYVLDVLVGRKVASP